MTDPEFLGIEAFFFGERIEGGHAFLFPKVFQSVRDLGSVCEIGKITINKFFNQLALAAEF